MGHGLFGAGCHHLPQLPQQPAVTLGAEGKSGSRKTAGLPGFGIDVGVLYFKTWHS